MPTKTTRHFAVAALAMSLSLSLGACTTANGDAMSQGNASFGEATASTFAAQIIDPNPEYLSATPVTSGDHAAQAIDRYRKDTVKKPEKIRTSKVGTSGGAGGGGD